MSILLTSGLIRGIIGQAVGTALGIAFISLIRAAMGLGAEPEPGVVFGALIGVIGFLLGAGTLTDWIKWIGGKQTPLRHGTPPGKPEWFSVTLTWTTTHKVIGIQYGITSVIVLLVGGIFALIFRIELSQAGLQFLNNEQYNTLFGGHGIVMIASILLGVGGMINYLVPLMIGASDMAFPRLNAFSYWVSLPAALLVLAGMAIGGWDTGWVAYPPLSLRSPMGVQLFLLGFYVLGFSSIAGSINLLVTVATMRAKGMSLFRMPIFVWAAVATSLDPIHGHANGLAFP